MKDLVVPGVLGIAPAILCRVPGSAERELTEKFLSGRLRASEETRQGRLQPGRYLCVHSPYVACFAVAWFGLRNKPSLLVDFRVVLWWPHPRVRPETATNQALRALCGRLDDDFAISAVAGSSSLAV